MVKVRKDFGEAMDDDLNVGQALAALFEFVREANNLVDSGKLSKAEAEEVRRLIVDFDKVLGVIGEVKVEEGLSREAKELIRLREEAR
jgi:cysteinyl-tRNA synthetase